MKKHKKTSGDGWSFIPAGGEQHEDAPGQSRAPEEHHLRVRTEKRAKGKLVTVVGPFELSTGDLAELSKGLKKACGTGGTVRATEIELQGDCSDRARRWLSAQGYGQ